MPDYGRGRRHSRHDDRYDDRYDNGYYSDSESDYEPRPKPRHRSVSRRALDRLGSAMEGLGLNRKDKPHSSSHHSPPRHRDRSRDRPRDRPHDYYPPSSSRSHRHHSTSPHHRSRRRSRHDSTSSRPSASREHSRLERGMQAAVDAAAVEAFRLRREPGPWIGAKGSRVATAAISAGVIGSAAEKRKEEGHGGKIGPLGSALGGLVINRLVNGPRKEVRY